MNQRTRLFFLIVLISFGYSYGQKEFREGFIITLEKDTIHGQVKLQSVEQNYQSCIFEIDGKQKKSFPDDILGFGYLGGQIFSSQVIRGSFVEVLVVGEVDLYKSGKKYHVLKEAILYDLEVIIEQYESDGKTSLRYKNEWRQILVSLTNDCLEKADSRVANLSFTDYSLSKYLAKYNECKNSNFTDFQKDKRVRVDFGAAVGLISSEIEITDRSGLFSFLNDSYHSVDPSVGLLLSVTEPQFSERLSLQAEFHFFRSAYQSLVELQEVNLEYHETHFDLSTLSIPVSVKYSSPKERLGWFAQAGVNTDFHFQSDAIVLTEEVIGNVVSTLPESPPFEVRRLQIGYFAGVGLIKPFKKFDASLSFRYFQFSRFNESEDGFSQNRAYGAVPDDGRNGNINNIPDGEIFDRVSRNNRIVVNLILWRK